MTGTLDESLTNAMVLEGLFGPIGIMTTTKELMDRGILSTLSIKAIVLNYPDDVRKSTKKDYQSEIDWIVRDRERIRLIKNLAASLTGNTLVLFQYVDKHGKELYNELKSLQSHGVHLIHGGVKGEDRAEIKATIRESSNNILCASYGTFQLGVNIPELDYLIFASPSKGKIRNLQSIGRVLRRTEDKTKAVLFDVVDDLSWKGRENHVLRHFRNRMSIYAEEGFDVRIYNLKVGKHDT